MTYRTEKKDSARKKLFRAVMLMLITVVLLTAGELYGNGEMPSWSGLFSGYMEHLQQAQQTLSGTDIAIHVIDVGQGDCTLVQSENVNILIDAGENGKGKEVALYLQRLGIERLDWLIATHPHSDHIGGVDEVMERIGVDNVMLTYTAPQREPKESYYQTVMEAIAASGVAVTYANAGDVYKFGELTMQVLHPVYGTDFEDMNDSSICLRFVSGGVSLLTCGDITYEAEEMLLQSGTNLRSTIYIANHHGSALSNTEEFIMAASPDYAVFSCGKNNSYGHPHKSVLDIMKKSEITYYRTDLQGTIVFSCTEKGIEITTEEDD